MYLTGEDKTEAQTLQRESEHGLKEKALFTLHVSFAVQIAVSNTWKMNCYLEGRKEAVLLKSAS